MRNPSPLHERYRPLPAPNLGSLHSRLRTPLRYAPWRTQPSALASQIRILGHFNLDALPTISYHCLTIRHHSLS